MIIIIESIKCTKPRRRELDINIFNSDSEDELWASGFLRSDYVHVVKFWFCS